MSKYTTEVRYICENACGYDSSKGYGMIDTIVSNAWDKIFTTKFPIYDEDYRSVLCSKILKHFYTREIGLETVGLWKYALNEKMEMIMPYYNQLYKSTLLEFNPLYDVDYQRTGDSDTNYDETTSDSAKSDNKVTDSNTSESDSLNYNLFSDTPQGGLNGVDNETYLTDARKITDHNVTENNGSQTNVYNGSSNGNKNFSNLNEYSEHVIGKQGGSSYSKMLEEFRNTFLNIDSMICDELEVLFMGLW